MKQTKKVRILLASVAVVAAISGVYFSGIFGTANQPLVVVDSSSGARERVETDSSQTESIELNKVGQLSEPNEPNFDESNGASTAEGSRSDGGDEKSLESSLTKDGVLNISHLLEMQSDDSFGELVAELRQDSSDVANERRSTYELLFYSQPLSKNGSVTLDTLECGSRLCVAELRALNADLMDEFIRGVTTADGFDGRTTTQLPGSPTYQGSNSRRLVFSHDSTTEGVSLPTDVFARTEKKPSTN